jgi:hypothetical protein
MKRFFLISLAFLLVSGALSAQKMNNIKTDLFSPIIRTYVLKYERALNQDMSFQLGFFYTGFRPFDSESVLSGYGITPEFRYYLSEKPAPGGFYLAPNVRYMKLTASDDLTSDEGSLTTLSLALNIGGQWILSDVVALDIWLGPSYNFRTVTATDGQVDFGIAEIDGFGIRAGLALGIAF